MAEKSTDLPPELMATRHLSGESPSAPVNPFAHVPPTTPVHPVDPAPAPAVNPFAAAPPPPVNPFAAAPPSPVNPFAAPPVNPFAAPPPPAVNPFAAAPAPAPNPFAAPAPVNPFADHVAPAMNPFAAPTTIPVGGPPAAPQPQPLSGRKPIKNLRPFTVTLTVGAAFYLLAWLYATYVATTLRVVTSYAGLHDLTSSLKNAESFHLLGLAGIIVVTILFWYRAGANARALCADKSRYSPHAAWTFLIPLLNVLVVGLAFEDISKHSHERRRPVAGVVRAFRIALIATLVLRLVVYLVYSGHIRGVGALDAAFFVLGFGDPARFIYQAGVEAQGLTGLVSLACACVPVLAVLSAFTIERHQVEAQRRVMASAL